MIQATDSGAFSRLRSVHRNGARGFCCLQGGGQGEQPSHLCLAEAASVQQLGVQQGSLLARHAAVWDLPSSWLSSWAAWGPTCPPRCEVGGPAGAVGRARRRRIWSGVASGSTGTPTRRMEKPQAPRPRQPRGLDPRETSQRAEGPVWGPIAGFAHSRIRAPGHSPSVCWVQHVRRVLCGRGGRPGRSAAGARRYLRGRGAGPRAQRAS